MYVKARSNGHNILTTFVVTCCDMPIQTATTTSQHFKNKRNCCEDVETKFKRIQTHHNMSQHVKKKEEEEKKKCHNIVVRGGQTVSISAHDKGCENVVRNVVTV